MTILNPYLGFRGNAREAMEFYHSVFGGDLTLSTFGESGMSQDPAEVDLIMHAQLTTPSSLNLMGSDTPERMELTVGSNVSVSLSGQDEAELRGYWDGLVAGYAIDALRAPAGAASVRNAEAFVARVAGATDTPRRAVGLGVDHTLDGDGVAGHSLEWKRAVVHLAAFVTAADDDHTRPTRVIDRNRWFGPIE